MRTGRYSFPYVTYDPPSDVLYARISQGRDASREQTEEGDSGPTTPTVARPV